MEDKRNIAFWSSCYKIFNEVEETDLRCILVLLKVDRGTRNTVKGAQKFVDVLEENGILSEDDCDNLIKLLRGNDYADLADGLQKCVNDVKEDDLTKLDLQEKRRWKNQVNELYQQGTRLRFAGGCWRGVDGKPYNFN